MWRKYHTLLSVVSNISVEVEPSDALMRIIEGTQNLMMSEFVVLFVIDREHQTLQVHIAYSSFPSSFRHKCCCTIMCCYSTICV
jgi:hypothetical protein